MQFRTEVHNEPSPFRITYSDPVMFVGSCFAAEIGSRLTDGKLPVMINPAGTVFNPVSVAATLRNVIAGKETGEEDLFLHNNTWSSFSHYTGFSGIDKGDVLRKINTANAEAHSFLKMASVLFITFGTARVYRYSQTGTIVSNCHRLPDTLFTRELLAVADIVGIWNNFINELLEFNHSLKIVFTISPVRHWKDGAHGNQVSKSVLFLAVEELLRHRASPGYFPAYEILMDELRDYRFYAADMLHPSEPAVEYIYEVFSRYYLDEKTKEIRKEAERIVMASRHRIREAGSGSKEFASNMLGRITNLEQSVPGIDFSKEKEYFRGLMDF